MSLWSSFSLPWLSHRDITTIRVQELTYFMMQGIDNEGRHYLATPVWYEGIFQVGFIIQRYAQLENEWEYGVPGKMDIWVMDTMSTDEIHKVHLGLV